MGHSLSHLDDLLYNLITLRHLYKAASGSNFSLQKYRELKICYCGLRETKGIAEIRSWETNTLFPNSS